MVSELALNSYDLRLNPTKVYGSYFIKLFGKEGYGLAIIEKQLFPFI